MKTYFLPACLGIRCVPFAVSLSDCLVYLFVGTAHTEHLSHCRVSRHVFYVIFNMDLRTSYMQNSQWYTRFCACRVGACPSMACTCTSVHIHTHTQRSPQRISIFYFWCGDERNMINGFRVCFLSRLMSLLLSTLDDDWRTEEYWGKKKSLCCRAHSLKRGALINSKTSEYKLLKRRLKGRT